MAPVFNDVKAILDKIIADWTAGNGSPPDLTGAGTHNTALFAWDTKQNLLNSSARNLQLIQQGIIGQKGQGATANLVVALTTGVPGFPPMPDGGLNSMNNQYLTLASPQIQTIIAWIEAGCPN
jgi:hypothetical protein